VGVPVVFANCVSRLAHSRTCASDPGIESSSGVYTVWIESTASTLGLLAIACAMIFSTSVSATSASADTAAFTRRARIAVCATDSSPVA